MASAEGNDNAVLMALTEQREFLSYGFFSLAMFIERLHADSPPIGVAADPEREPVRFRATPTLGFPPEEISAVKRPGDGGDRMNIYVNILGLHGPSSPLPASYTEHVIDEEGAGAIGDFFDFFNHRLISLLLLIWKYSRHHLRYSAGAADPISSLIGALFGQISNNETPDEREWRARLLPHVGVLALCSRSARLVADIISSHLSIRCRIEEFVPREIDVPEDVRWRLGRSGLLLGVDTILGETMSDVAGKFRVHLGPLSREQFHSLLPGREDHRIVSKLINITLREPLAWDLWLELAPGTAPAWVLGESELGWTTLIDPKASSVIPVLL